MGVNDDTSKILDINFSTHVFTFQKQNYWNAIGKRLVIIYNRPPHSTMSTRFVLEIMSNKWTLWKKNQGPFQSLR